jgi:hypothetical protein
MLNEQCTKAGGTKTETSCVDNIDQAQCCKGR